MANEPIERREFEEHKKTNNDEFKSINRRLVSIEETQEKLTIGQSQLTDQIKSFKIDILNVIERNTQSQREQAQLERLKRYEEKENKRTDNIHYYIKLAIGSTITLFISKFLFEFLNDLSFYIIGK